MTESEAIQDVLVDAAERGYVASQSEGEKKTILDLLKIFKSVLLANMREGDVPGIMAPAYIIRGSDMLGGGLVLVLEDRALVAWMKGMFRKPVVEAVPLDSITEVKLGTKAPSRRISKVNRAVFVKAAQNWEILCSPDVPEEAPLYGTLAGLLGGKVKAHEIKTVESAEGAGSGG